MDRGGCGKHKARKQARSFAGCGTSPWAKLESRSIDAGAGSGRTEATEGINHKIQNNPHALPINRSGIK